VALCDPDREEEEGYRAAQAGSGLDRNPYPPGTMRFDDWRRGWQIRHIETRIERDRTVTPDEVGESLADNPHPRGTIRYEQWRDAWQVKQFRLRRARRTRPA
jgi:hypothetical protein